MTSNPLWISTGLKDIDPIEIRLGNGTIVKGNQIGDVKLSVKTQSEWKDITVEKVLVVPEIKKKLLLVGAIQDKGSRIIF